MKTVKAIPSALIKYPLSTEKAIRLMEAENKLLFIVDDSATKATIKQEIERLFNTKVKTVNTFNIRPFLPLYDKCETNGG